VTDPVFLVPDLADQLERVGEAGQFTLPAAEAKHAAVKRIRTGEPVVLTDGNGLGVSAAFGTADTVAGVGVLPARSPRPRVTVVQAIPKSERSELAVDLAVQAGADRIIPWQSDRCIAKWDGKPGKAEKARAKWEAVAVSAMKQSRRLDGAQVGDLLTDIDDLADVLADRPWPEPVESILTLVLHEEAATPLAQLDLDVDEIVLVIGPEGGVSPREVEIGQPVVLGPEVYRTASAAAVALGAIGVLTTRWAR
jgi:16S rRNA (uracil1498-N3)-methyltransferase